jgi:hypothetical protein
MCFRPCASDMDCRGGARCFQEIACLPACTTAADCPGPASCVEGYCFARCFEDSQCRSGHCDLHSGRCTDGSEPTGAGLLEPCLRDDECRSGTCHPELQRCTTICSLSEPACPDDGLCMTMRATRPGEVESDFGLCVPRCTTQAECSEGTICGRAERPEEGRGCIPDYFAPCSETPGTVGDGWSCGCDSDCMDGALCAGERTDDYPGGRCFRECETTADCRGGAVCDFGVCDIPCTTDADCPLAHLCDSDGVCFALCQSDEECVTTRHCNLYRGRCTDGTGEDRLGIEAPCTRDEQCNSEICSSGRCSTLCRESRQACPEEAVCASGADADDLGFCLPACDRGGACAEGTSCRAVPFPSDRRVCL